MACNAHTALSVCLYHSNTGQGAPCPQNQQPCPSNVVNLGPYKIGTTILAAYTTALRTAIINEQKRRYLTVSSFSNDVYIEALIKYYNLSDIRTAINTMENTGNYCFCNCNYSCACVKHGPTTRVCFKFMYM